MQYKILDSQWRSAKHTIGFVAFVTDGKKGEWNCVVGVSLNSLFGGDQINQKVDEQYIAANGSKIEWQIAQILFPNLDITKHKYYGGVA